MLVAVVRLRRDPLRLTLSEPFGARLTDAEATGTIINTDALPRAWLARFGRTAAGHMLESVREPLHGDAPAVSRVTIAGHRLPTGADRAALIPSRSAPRVRAPADSSSRRRHYRMAEDGHV